MVEIPVLYSVSSEKQMDMLWGDIHHGVCEDRPVQGIGLSMKKRPMPTCYPSTDLPERGDGVLWGVGLGVGTGEISPS